MKSGLLGHHPLTPLRGQRNGRRCIEVTMHFLSSLHCGPSTSDNLVPVSVYLDCILSSPHWCSVNRMCGRCGSILHCSIYADSKSTFRPHFVSSFNVLIKGAFFHIFLFLILFVLRALTRGALFLFIVKFLVSLHIWFHLLCSLTGISIVYKGPAFNNKRQKESNHLNTVSTW